MNFFNGLFLAAATKTSQAAVTTNGAIKGQTNFLQNELEGLLNWVIGFGKSLLIALIVFIVGKKLIRVLMKLVKKALERSNVDVGVSGFVVTLVKTAGYVLLLVIIAGILGLETSSLVAVVGSAGLTIGLALQGSLSNLAGGVLILINKPFKVGDNIVADINEGIVSKIDIFYTHIVTPDNKDIVLPNGALSNMNVINSTREVTRRLDLIIPVAYQSDIDHVRETLLSVCKKDERILTEQEPQIYLYEFGASAINMIVRVWTSTENYWPLKWSLQEEVKKALDKEGITIPYTQMDVNLIHVDKKE